jgi:hypothetical protein
MYIAIVLFYTWVIYLWLSKTYREAVGMLELFDLCASKANLQTNATLTEKSQPPANRQIGE